MRAGIFIIFSLFCAHLALAGRPPRTPFSPFSEDAWQAWKTQHDQELKDARTSYLSVQDHALLKPGETVYLALGGPRGEVGFRREELVKPMVSLAHKGSRIEARVPTTGEVTNLPEGSGDWSTPDGMAVSAERVGDNVLLTLRDPQKDGFRDFKGTLFFSFNPQGVVRGRLDALAKPERQSVLTTQGQPREIWYLGTVELAYAGHHALLKAYGLGAQPSRKELFIPFLDATNGMETYAGGRYVEAEAGESGLVTIDFNRAYNPYCARNHIFSCIKVSGRPIEARITAGEKNPVAR